MLPFSLIIFDFDGTLADSFPWFCSVMNDTARKFGFREIQEREIGELRELGTRQILERLGVPSWKLPAIAIHMRQLSAQSLGAVSLFPGAYDALAALSARGIKIAVVSSNAEETCRRTLGEAAAYVNAFNCSASLWGKSSKFKSVAKSLGMNPGQAIAVGDEVRDIQAARRVGISCGAVTFGYNTAAALAAYRPDFIFKDYEDLQRQFLEYQ